MINVVGNSNTPEYAAGNALRTRILEAIPELRTSLEQNVLIVAGAKCHGQRVRDIDLVLLGQFDSPITFQPFVPFVNPRDETTLEMPESVTVHSICAVIEVKDHPIGKVQIQGTRVEVLYTSPAGRDEWKDASHQNEEQLHSLRNYLAVHRINPPYIVPLLWLRNVDSIDLPKLPHNILGGDATWEMFLNVINQNSRPKYRNGKWLLDANYPGEASLAQLKQLLSEEIVPTGLDRQRMEQVNKRIVDEQRLHEMVGNQLLILRGRGGAGKTIRLLQLAKRLYDEQLARVLILTYNRALVADLRRLLTLLGIVDDISMHSIQVQTVHSFFYSLLHSLGVMSMNEDDFFSSYETLKAEALALLNAGVLNDSDIAHARTSGAEAVSWDYVFIDEGQDWPADERDILFLLYQPQVVTVADGIDQLIRSQRPVNWRERLTRDQYKVITLEKCLRMKAGLTRFVSQVASELGLPGREWIANEAVTGGKVVVVETTDPLQNRKMFDELVASNQRSGNQPVDMLFCVPPSMVLHSDAEGGHDQSRVASVFIEWGLKVWDGTASTARSTYPTNTEQLRIVQYDSARGLEGWTVFLFAADEFYDYKLRQMSSDSDDPTIVQNRAARWLLIPLTRAMDTLVIHVSDVDSALYAALKRAYAAFPEFVEWQKS